MTDKELTEWEHQPLVLNVLTSREMGAWLGRRDSRRDSRLLQEIRQEMAKSKYNHRGEYNRELAFNICLQIIDSKIKEYTE